MPRPFVLLGHSAGGAAALETLWSEPASADAAILVAPLVRPMRMALAGLGALVLAPFVHTVPPFGAEEDYLGVAHLPLSWVRALSRWESRFSERPSIEVPILIIQGEDDDFLDWRHGLEVIARSAPRAETHILAGVGHIPFDTKEAQERALTLIIPFLSTLEAPDSM
jgi:pimeloyl-ACP methyl ester carboxylesterase